MQKVRDIQERTFEFALRVVKLSQGLSPTKESWVIAKQLLRSGTSIGANVEEAHAASSRADFVYRIEIALREARETSFWLRLIKASNLLKAERIDEIIAESEELKKILGAIASKSRGKAKSRD
jgi:four helix bundle protein